MSRSPVVSLLAIMLLATSCTTDDTRSEAEPPSFQTEGHLAFVNPDGDTLRSIDVEIADTDPEREQGLMRRRSLGYDRGMLFVFESVDKSGMWMKNTPLPLDIVFVSPDSQVINIARRTTPFSEKTISPAAPKKYVIEVRAGFADRFGLSTNTRVRWNRTN